MQSLQCFQSAQVCKRQGLSPEAGVVGAPSYVCVFPVEDTGRKLGPESWLHHFLAVWFWVNGKMSLSLSLLSSKRGLQGPPLRGMPIFFFENKKVMQMRPCLVQSREQEGGRHSS